MRTVGTYDTFSERNFSVFSELEAKKFKVYPQITSKNKFKVKLNVTIRWLLSNFSTFVKVHINPQYWNGTYTFQLWRIYSYVRLYQKEKVGIPTLCMNSNHVIHPLRTSISRNFAVLQQLYLRHVYNNWTIFCSILE